MSENALKACPLDGAPARLCTVERPYVRFWVKCTGCGLTSPRRSTREAAEQFWNTRSPVCEDARKLVKLLREVRRGAAMSDYMAARIDAAIAKATRAPQ